MAKWHKKGIHETSIVSNNTPRCQRNLWLEKNQTSSYMQNFIHSHKVLSK